MYRKKSPFGLIGLAFLASSNAHASAITFTDRTDVIGPVQYRAEIPGEGVGNAYQAYDTSKNIALNASITSPAPINISQYDQYVHQPEFLVDGYYGNGASYIPEAGILNGWFVLDFGSSFDISAVKFGRDRSDYDPPLNERNIDEFIVSVSTNGTDYQTVLDSTNFSLNTGDFVPGWSILGSFDSISAQYLRFDYTSQSNAEVAIDEFEVYQTSVPTPGTALAMALGLLGLWVRQRK